MGQLNDSKNLDLEGGQSIEEENKEAVKNFLGQVK